MQCSLWYLNTSHGVYDFSWDIARFRAQLRPGASSNAVVRLQPGSNLPQIIEQKSCHGLYAWLSCSDWICDNTKFTCHAEGYLQVWPPGTIQFRADSNPLPPATPRQQPPADLVGCVTQSHDAVKAWVRSNAGMLLRSGRGFDKTY